MSVLRAIWRILRWPIIVLLAAFVALFLYELARTPQRTAETVASIHTKKLTIKDVDGSNLPPKPDPQLVDATVEGIDANTNGIRDDVELAIFKKYPNDTKLRAAALQYALTLQTYLTEVTNSDTWIAGAEMESRAFGCVFDNSSDYESDMGYVDRLTLNTERRQKSFAKLGSYETSFKVPSEKSDCDLSL